MVTTFLVMRTSHFAWLECIWFAIAWTPKVPAGCASRIPRGLRSYVYVDIQLIFSDLRFHFVCLQSL